jgi:Domain of unknown function (DUF1995)
MTLRITLYLVTALFCTSAKAFAPSSAALEGRRLAPSTDTTTTTTTTSTDGVRRLFASVEATATQLPDSLEDAAQRAAQATADYVQVAGPMARCRIDFDTSVGDETYTILKTSTEFMQNLVTACCYAMIPGLQEQRQAEMMRVVQAKTELRSLVAEPDYDQDKAQKLQQIIASGGVEQAEGGDADGKKKKWKGPVCRVYFPDEGSAALARRDWMGAAADNAKVPACVQFSSCGGVQMADISQDRVIFFFCPKASESDDVEKILQKTELAAGTNLLMSCFVNPNLVDMGVTGFGMAGRRLRERLIDPLQQTYYLRTLQWGALTRLWPQAYSVWQEDANEEGGYRLIKTLDRLPSNPEVEDIYDIANGDKQERKSGGVLDQLGDFVNGMMRL